MQKRYKAEELIKIGEKTFTKETVKKFENTVNELRKGNDPLYKCCEIHGLTTSDFYDIMNADKEKEKVILCARESFFDKKIEKIIEISERDDLSTEDRKIRILAIEKAAQLSMPKRYRDRQETTVNIQANSQVVRFEIPSDNR